MGAAASEHASRAMELQETLDERDEREKSAVQHMRSEAELEQALWTLEQSKSSLVLKLSGAEAVVSKCELETESLRRIISNFDDREKSLAQVCRERTEQLEESKQAMVKQRRALDEQQAAISHATSQQ